MQKDFVWDLAFRFKAGFSFTFLMRAQNVIHYRGTRYTKSIYDKVFVSLETVSQNCPSILRWQSFNRLRIHIHMHSISYKICNQTGSASGIHVAWKLYFEIVLPFKSETSVSYLISCSKCKHIIQYYSFFLLFWCLFFFITFNTKPQGSIHSHHLLTVILAFIFENH